jgi:hypothetical protein
MLGWTPGWRTRAVPVVPVVPVVVLVVLVAQVKVLRLQILTTV